MCPQPVPPLRRVGIAINLTYSLRHHYSVFAGIQQFAHGPARWETIVQPRMRIVAGGRGRPAYDGIVARATAELAKDAAAAGIPLVNVWSGSPATWLPSVFPDYAAVGAMAAEHLLKRGFRQLAFAGVRGHMASNAALRTFQEAARRAQCGFASFIFSARSDESNRAWEHYQERLHRWIAQRQPPVGVLVMNDTYCRYLADACLHARLRIPEDVALIGVGNESLICSQPPPSLSSFDVDQERVGYEAARLLGSLMDGAAPPQAPVLVQPRELVLRHSTDTYVVDDPLVSAALRFIVEHAHEGIRVNEVAKHVCASLRSLELHFQAVMGRTMSKEIARLRIERAKRLLMDGGLQIKEVAGACGFSSSKHFHRMFRLSEGISPSNYRACRTRPRPS